MRRRLWWSLVLFDTRIGELAFSNNSTLTPTWDCKIPLNVNDSDLRPEMKEPPQVQVRSTGALFAVVRSEVGDFVRHTMYHLDYLSAAFQRVAPRNIPDGSELVNLEKMIENKYLKACDLENPLHFMTFWTTRAYLARCRLVELHSKSSTLSMYRLESESQRDAVISYALGMLEGDTKVMTSPLTKGFLWYAHSYFPFWAYIQIAQILKRQPVNSRAEEAWEAMSDNYEARFSSLHKGAVPFHGAFFKIFSNMVLHAWEARETWEIGDRASKRLRESLMAPRIVISIRYKMARLAQTDAPDPIPRQSKGPTNMDVDGLPYHVGANGVRWSRPGLQHGRSRQLRLPRLRDIPRQARTGSIRIRYESVGLVYDGLGFGERSG